jgi:hypothetical protein
MSKIIDRKSKERNAVEPIIAKRRRGRPRKLSADFELINDAKINSINSAQTIVENHASQAVAKALKSRPSGIPEAAWPSLTATIGKPARLTDEVKRFITQLNACGRPPAAVVTMVKDFFGVEVSRRQVEYYDPTKTAGADLALRYRALFFDTQARYWREMEDVGLTHQKVRMDRLDRMCQEAEVRGNYRLAARIIVTAAKEMGSMYLSARHEPPMDPRLALSKLLGVPIDRLHEHPTIMEIEARPKPRHRETCRICWKAK